MLDEEARLADELPRTFGEHLGRALGPVLGIGDLVLLVLLLVHDHESVLQDDVEARLHVVRVDLVVILVVVVVVGHHAHGHDDVVLDQDIGDVVDLVDHLEDVDVLLDEVLVVLVKGLEIDDVGVVRLLDVLEFLVWLVRHVRRIRSEGGVRGWQHRRTDWAIGGPATAVGTRGTVGTAP